MDYAVGRIIKVSDKGYGFISSKEIEFTRIFFHWTSLIQNTLSFKELKVGMIVEFKLIKVPMKGYRAVHIKVIEGEKNNVPEVSPLPESGPDATGEIT